MFTEILAARNRLHGRIHQTPVLTSRILNEALGCDVWIKAESLQKTGSFKVRGVLNFLDTQDIGSRGVACYSSGNHGQAVAWAARGRGFPAWVFVPQDATEAKVSAIAGYGGHVEEAGVSVEERRRACESFAASQGVCVIPPFDHRAIISGQGTVMLEVLEEIPIVDAVLVPVGGGGLLAGCAVVAKTLRPNVEVIACETSDADDACRSLASGKLMENPHPPRTIADGMRHQRLGDVNWEIIQGVVDAGLICTEADVIQAMKRYAQTFKQIVEPSGAVSLGCLMAHGERFRGKRVVLIASGGNVELNALGGWLA